MWRPWAAALTASSSPHTVRRTHSCLPHWPHGLASSARSIRSIDPERGHRTNRPIADKLPTVIAHIVSRSLAQTVKRLSLGNCRVGNGGRLRARLASTWVFGSRDLSAIRDRSFVLGFLLLTM